MKEALPREDPVKQTILFLIVGLLVSSVASASEYLDDLGTINLNLETSETTPIQVNYPGYRLGGGTPPRREITDCLILDIQSTDEEVTTAMKLELAKRLIVEDGARFGEDGFPRLRPEVKGENVVFRLVSKHSYMTHIFVKTKNDKALQANIDQVVKTPAIPVGLVYVRGCRF